MRATDNPVTIDILAMPETAASGLYGFSDVLSSVGVAWETTVSKVQAAVCMSCQLRLDQEFAPEGGPWRMTFRFRDETVFDLDLEQYH